MAKRIVSHTGRLCKVQNNPKIEAVSALFKESDKLYYQQAGEALSMSNDEAIEFLRSVGFSQIIPGTHFAPEGDYARFFDVEKMSFHNYVHRYGLNRSENPLEAFSCDLKYFFKHAGLFDVGEVVSPAKNSSIFDFQFKGTGAHYVTRNSWSTRLLSARVATGMIPILANWFGRYHSDCKIAALHRELTSFMAKKREEEARIAAKVEEAKKAEELKSSMTEDMLYRLIKKAVSEVMSGATIAIAAPVTNT